MNTNRSAYKVNVTENGNAIGSYRVEVATREEAPAAAIAAAVEFAVKYNAKWGKGLDSNGVGWAKRNTNAADYSTSGTARKVRAS